MKFETKFKTQLRGDSNQNFAFLMFINFAPQSVFEKLVANGSR